MTATDFAHALLAHPTVAASPRDRLVQQALLQVLTSRFDPHFSDSSFGFRPGRRGKEAVGRAREFVREGYRWVVDLDLEKCRVDDKHVLRLIRRYLQAGILVDGVALTAEEGTPQGGPLSPLLANVLLDDLDKELERRGHRFVRYADDCNVYVRTRRAGERVMEGITEVPGATAETEGEPGQERRGPAGAETVSRLQADSRERAAHPLGPTRREASEGPVAGPDAQKPQPEHG